MPHKQQNRLLFLSLPQNLPLFNRFGDQSQPEEHFSINPDIPIPVEIPDNRETLNMEELSPEMIISGMLRVIAAGKNDEANVTDSSWIDYYRDFVMALRPAILGEFTEAAILKARNGDFDLAMEIFDVLQGLFPSSSTVAMNRAMVMEERDRKKLDREKSTINDIDKNGPEDESFNEAYAFIQQGNDEAGMKRIRDFIEKYPLVWNGWFLLGWALRHLSRWKDAAAAFGKALELGSPDSDTRNETAICLMESNDLKGARRELETALHNDPENIKIISNLGVIALKSGNREEAAAFFRTVLEIDPDDPIAKQWGMGITTTL